MNASIVVAICAAVIAVLSLAVSVYEARATGTCSPTLSTPQPRNPPPRNPPRPGRRGGDRPGGVA
jgi:hypothetical protein